MQKERVSGALSMNEEKYREYEQKLEEVHKQFKKIRLKVRLIWVLWMLVTGFVCFCFIFGWDPAVGIAVFVFDLLASYVVMQSRLKFWKRAEMRQEDIIREQAPMGGFKFD